ncbi:MAG: pyruvate ferredoxin oxidoreductase [Actinobacteria bacterium]|nr:pyruvate ferredoxin oxidoreductase [Actinomycetota bacterium]
MAKTVALTGNAACAQAMRQINPDVVAAYPITPQTTIVEEFATFVANGKVNTEFINVESEHSAMSACVGASAAGARVMTTTSSQGLALMWEILYIASSLRLPIVMHNVNRTLSGPINIHCDHSDSMGARDAGWIQLFCENAQEAYDTTIQAIRIAENKNVHLPVMILYDGFIISHAITRLELLEDEDVKKFVGDYKPEKYLLDIENPVAVGSFDGLHGFYFEHKKVQNEVIERSKDVIVKVGNEYGKLSGRSYGLFEEYKLDDAEVGIVVLGSTAGTAKLVVDQMRDNNKKVGLLKLRSFRPFPAKELFDSLKKLKALAVLDRSSSTGSFGGPLFGEIRSAFYDGKNSPKIIGYIYGLGGRDVSLNDIEKVCNDLSDIVKTGKIKKEIDYLGVRE